MNFFKALDNVIRSTSGTVGEVAGLILSLPETSITAIVKGIEGEDPRDAANIVMNKYAEQGKIIGQEEAYTILKILGEAVRRTK